MKEKRKPSVVLAYPQYRVYGENVQVCHLDHPNGRMMDQLRPNIDYCATCILVRPADIGQISGAFQDEFPASDESMDSCEFVAAVPLGVAFKDWKVTEFIRAGIV